MRHAEVLLGRLKERSGYAQFADGVSDFVSLGGATAAQFAVYPPGEATAEDEPVQLYGLNFGSGGRALLATVDSHNSTHLRYGSTLSDFEASQVNNMAPRVCAALRGRQVAGRRAGRGLRHRGDAESGRPSGFDRGRRAGVRLGGAGVWVAVGDVSLGAAS